MSFDMMKFFAIFLVIWGHCVGEFLSSDRSESALYRYIYSFHMPLFMTISGYFACSSMTMGVYDFIAKKFRQLIYPCLVWGGILWIVLECANSFHYGNPQFSFVGLLTDYYWLSDFWFLKSCFICYLLAYAGVRSGLSRKYWAILTLVISQVISPFFVSFMYPCFLLGMELRQNSVLMKKVLSGQYVLSALFLVMLAFWSRDVWNQSHGLPPGLMHAETSVWAVTIYSRLFRLLIGIVGGLSVIPVFMNLFKTVSSHSLVRTCCDWGKYTLEVYILQSLVLEKSLGHYISLDDMHPFLFNCVVTPIASCAVLVCCILIIKQIYKWGFLGKMLFGSAK